jgi:hypothetical protein
VRRPGFAGHGVRALCALLVLSGCQLTTAPGFLDLTLRVEAGALATSRGGGEVVVPFTVRNRGDETARLPRCGDDLLFELQRSENGQWANVRAALCLTVHDMSPLPLAPGAAVQGVYRVDRVPGRYRLVLGVQSATGEPRPLVSDPFVVE